MAHRNRILRILTVLALITPACKDERVTDIQENLRRLSELCTNEQPSGYCNGDKPKSRIKFAIEDGKIVYDPGKGNFVYSESGKTVAGAKSDEEKERDKEFKQRRERVRRAVEESKRRKPVEFPDIESLELKPQPVPAATPEPEKKGPGSNIDWGFDEPSKDQPKDTRRAGENVDWSQ